MQHRSHSANSSENGYAVVLARRPSGAVRSTKLPISNLARPSPALKCSSIRAGPYAAPEKIEKTPRKAGAFVRMCARLLIALIISQPIYVANGMEIADVGEGVSVRDETVAAQAENTQAESDTEELEEDVVEDSNQLPEEDEILDVGDEEEVEDIKAATDSEAEIEGVATTTDDELNEETDESEEESTETTGGGTNNNDEEEEENDTETASTTDESIATTATSTATSTASADTGEEDVSEVATTTEEITDADNQDGSYVFNEGECTIVADEEFYCFKNGSEVTAPSGKITAIAAPDSEGDREIYLVTAGGTERITNNMVDDFAPAYDPRTGRIVWHSMIEDRLQIMLYDRTLGVVQLTDGPNNSSNPHLYGDRVVWQEWIGNNWEIVWADNAGGVNMEVTVLTANEVHDMFPQMYAEFITWQRQTREGWEVVVYDVRADTESSIAKDGDGKYENPRFMLLFDKRTKEGDIETVGYDLATGDTEDLKTTPRGPRDPVTPRDETGDAAQVAGVVKPSERRDASDDDNPPVE